MQVLLGGTVKALKHFTRDQGDAARTSEKPLAIQLRVFPHDHAIWNDASAVGDHARAEGIALLRTPSGFGFAPLMIRKDLVDSGRFKSFSDMNGGEKLMFLVKLVVFFVTFGFAFGTLLD